MLEEEEKEAADMVDSGWVWRMVVQRGVVRHRRARERVESDMCCDKLEAECSRWICCGRARRTMPCEESGYEREWCYSAEARSCRGEEQQ